MGESQVHEQCILTFAATICNADCRNTARNCASCTEKSSNFGWHSTVSEYNLKHLRVYWNKFERKIATYVGVTRIIKLDDWLIINAQRKPHDLGTNNFVQRFLECRKWALRWDFWKLIPLGKIGVKCFYENRNHWNLDGFLGQYTYGSPKMEF